MLVNCIDCGILVKNKHNRKWCPACSDKHREEHLREYNKGFRDRKKWEKKKLNKKSK